MLNRQLLHLHTVSACSAAQVLHVIDGRDTNNVPPTVVSPGVVSATDSIIDFQLQIIGKSPASEVPHIEPDDQFVVFGVHPGEVLLDVV